MSMICCENYNGVQLPPEFSLIKEKIRNLPVKNEDIWVTSYPKAGTTWCQEMVWLLSNNLNYEKGRVDLDLRFPFLESNSFEIEKVKFVKEHNLPTKNMRTLPDFLKLIEEWEGPRFIKTHLPWEFLPIEITKRTKTPKIIHIMRNPKDTAGSYYYHQTNFLLFAGSLDEFIDMYIKGDVLFGDYFTTVLSYWEKRDLPNLLILTYEEMHLDLMKTIRKVSDFLGKSYGEQELQKLAQHLSFEEMKGNDAVNNKNYMQNEGGQFMRKGKVGSYKEELTPDMISKLNRWINEKPEGTGLPYAI